MAVLKKLIFFPDCAVHEQFVHRSGDGEELSVVADDCASFGIDDALFADWPEILYDLLAGLPSPLDPGYPDHHHGRKDKEGGIEVVQDHSDPVPFLLCRILTLCRHLELSI